ncbi:MAG: hypothetical protein DMF61_02105 [Blastocatellia bacterium AA13]|nr:MAG: hypothetical protein DMF61_02105 [Blastocatellia bacterium AA13]
MAGKIFRNVTKAGFVRGTSILIILAGAEGPYATKWGIFGLHLKGIPLWCFPLLASTGGILFFLWPMIFGSDPARRIEGGMKESPKMLFLYLRPFELDARAIFQLAAGASPGILSYAGLLNGIWWPLSFAPQVITISKEQSFKDALERLGEFIAFGRPTEWLRPIGASRIYAGNDWPERVASYIERARLIIVRPGNGESIRWEMEEVLRTESPHRILFYLGFRGAQRRRDKAYRDFRAFVEQRCPAKLPEDIGKNRYLIFDASWNARLLNEENGPAAWIRQAVTRSGDVTIDRLRPVLDELKIAIPVKRETLDERVISAGIGLMMTLIAGFVAVVVLISVVRVLIAFALYLLAVFFRIA